MKYFLNNNASNQHSNLKLKDIIAFQSGRLRFYKILKKRFISQPSLTQAPFLFIKNFYCIAKQK